MKFNTLLSHLLNIKYPIISAPMANISGGLLATEVTKAGGLGLIGGGYGHQEWLEEELDKVNDNEFGVGFITWRLAENPQLLDLTLAKKPKAIMLSFGDIKPFVEPIKAAGIPLICQVQTVLQARECKQLGADIIVAQGSEAGGHGANRGGMALIPAVVDAVSPLPVIAAGGICDARGIAAAMMLGASGVLMGTRFFASHESLASAAAKKRLLEATGDNTLRTDVFDFARGYHWPQPYSARALKNQFTERWHGIDNRAAKITADVQQNYQKALSSNNFEEAALFVGEGVDLIGEIMSAKDIINQLVCQLRQIKC